MPAGGPAAIDRVQQFDNEGGNEGGELMRTQQDGIEYVKRRDFEARFDDPSNIEPTESHKGAGFIFLVFTFIIVIAMAVSIEIVNGGNIWGLGEELGLGHLFPLEFQAPQYIPPRTCGDKNGDHVPDDTLMNCNSTMLVAAGLPESDTWAVVSPRAETECEPKGEKCQPEVCCVDLGPNCEDDPVAGSTYNTAWALGDGGCAQGEGCGETRLPDTQTAAECLAAVKAANDAATPTIFVSADNSWPPAGIPQGVSANGVTWGRGTPEVHTKTPPRTHERSTQTDGHRSLFNGGRPPAFACSALARACLQHRGLKCAGAVPPPPLLLPLLRTRTGYSSRW